jgi:hypothetical protein
LPRRFHSALAVLALPIIGLSWWLLPRSTPAAPRPPVPPTPLSQAPFGVWRGPYAMQPSGLWEEVGILELQVTTQLVENTPLTRAYRVAARLRSSRYGLLTGSGALRQDKAHPERGWVLDPLRADHPPGGGRWALGVGPWALGLGPWADQTAHSNRTDGTDPSDPVTRPTAQGPRPNAHRPRPTAHRPPPTAQTLSPTFPSPAFEITSAPATFWDGATLVPRLVVRTWVSDGAPRYMLEGEVTLERRSDSLPRIAPRRQIAVCVERPEMPPSDLRRAIENLAAPGSPEAAQPLPPRAEESAVQVRVLDAAGRPVAGERVRVRISPVPESGGHSGVHSGPRPHGWLLPEVALPVRPGVPRIGSLDPEWLGTTDAAGELRLRYRAPELAGVETLSAELAHDPETRAFIELRVGLPLVALPPNPDYYLVGGTPSHPSLDNDPGTSHFVTAAVLAKLAAVAAEFRRATGLPLRVNDSSLPWGGVFDIDGGWERPHYNHRDGTDIDLAVFGYAGSAARSSAPRGSPPPALLFRAPVFGPPEFPPIQGSRALAMSEVELLAGAVRRQGGRPGFEGDHIHASFGPLRFAEGPPRPTPAVPDEELSPELKEFLDSLEMLPDEATVPSAPAAKGVPAATGSQPADVAPPSEQTPDAKRETAPVKPSEAHPPAPAATPDAKLPPSVRPVTEPATAKDSVTAPPPASPPATPPTKPPVRPAPPVFDPTAPLAPPAGPPGAEKPAPREKESNP